MTSASDPAPAGVWQFHIDTGGTFTDCLAVSPDGSTSNLKILSSSALRTRISGLPQGHGGQRFQIEWRGAENALAGLEMHLFDLPAKHVRVTRYVTATRTVWIDAKIPGLASGMTVEFRAELEPPVLAAHVLTGTPPGEPLPPLQMRLATTRGTNALLERKVAPTALFITGGFADLLEIGTQQRPDLFALRIEKPAPLHAAVIEVDERLNADGSVLRPLQAERLTDSAAKLRQSGIQTAAVALLHATKNPDHELAVAEILRDAGFTSVSLSSGVAPFARLLPRAQTTLVNACLEPIIRRYLSRILEHTQHGGLHVMTSAGGLIGAEKYLPRDSLLSGPAAGVVGAAQTGRQSGFDHLITFDMGGTSTDVARFASNYEYLFEYNVGDAHLLSTALAIETVAAGGGSICEYRGGRFQVGPESAGASPGPACYGAGGPLTLTDVNLLLGRLWPKQFSIPVNPEAARTAADVLLRSAGARDDGSGNEEKLLEGLLQIANERMAAVIKNISISRGYDLQDYALLAFGGAGGQHACDIASMLEMQTVLFPPRAALLSAHGLANSVIERFAERQVLKPLADFAPSLGAALDALTGEAKRLVKSEPGVREEPVIRRRIVTMRFAGQDTSLALDIADVTGIATLFQREYKNVYGYAPTGREIEIESLRVVVSEPETRPARHAVETRSSNPQPVEMTRAWVNGSWREIPVYARDRLLPGDAFAGAGLVFEHHSAYFVGDGWQVSVDNNLALIARRENFAS